MAQMIFQMALSFALSKIAANLADEQADGPLVDEKPTTRSTRGSFIPVVQGPRRVGTNIGWVGNRSTITESGGSGGKGGGQSSTANDQLVYFESAWHVIAVGPCTKLLRIYANGEILDIGGPISAESSPSGSQFTATGTDFSGTFRIYWGEKDQPVNINMSSDDRTGVQSSWPFICYVEWVTARLGGFAQWPALEYVIEGAPYNTTDILTTTDPWVDNALTSVDSVTDPIGTVLNSAGVGIATIKIFDDGSRATSYTAGGFVNIDGQANVHVNRSYELVSATYDAVEQMIDPNGGSTFDYDVEDDLTVWTQNADIDSVTTGLELPVVAGGVGVNYQVASSVDKEGYIRHTVTGLSALSNGPNSMKVWVYHHVNNQNVHTQFNILLALETINGPNSPTDDHRHAARVFFWANGGVTWSGSNGGVITSITPEDANGWREITFVYFGGTGDDASNSLWDRVLFISGSNGTDPNNQQGAVKYYHEDEWTFYNSGAAVSGVTTLLFQDPLLNAVSFLGTTQVYQEGGGLFRGTNPIHTLVHLMFNRHPHGAGMKIERFSLDSLNAAAEFFAVGGTEPYRCSLWAQNGESYKAIIANIMMDLGVMWSWDASITKYVLEIIREPVGAVPTVPADAILPPKAEVDSVQGVMASDRIIFGYPDQDLHYRDNGVPASDHGQSDQRGGSRRADIIPLYTVVDWDQATKVAERRSQEEFAPPTLYKHNISRESRLLRPGLPLVVAGFDPVERIVAQVWDTNTSKMGITCFTDNYGLDADDVLTLTSQGGNNQPDAANLMSLGFELPAVLTPDLHIEFLALRVRAAEDSGTAAYWLSEDNLTYRSLGQHPGIATGGTLQEEVPETSNQVIETGPLLDVVGPDMLRISKTLTRREWRAGKQWALVGSGTSWEIWYVREAVIISSTVVRLDGIIRSPLGSSDTHELVDNAQGRFEAVALPPGQTMSEDKWTNEKQYASLPTHPIGTEVFLFQIEDIPKFTDLTIQPGADVYIKSQPLGDRTPTLAAIFPDYLPVTGKTYKPVQMGNLRLENMTRGYVTGTDPEIRWSITRNSAKRERVGGGWFAEQETSAAEINMEGTFTLKIWDQTDTLVRTVTDLTEPTYSYSNANLVSDLGSEVDFIVGVQYTRRGYSTKQIKLYISAV